MTDLSAEFKALASYRPTHKVRFVTAASLFDGHDAAINIMRRILQNMGAEVIHLGHNRSVDDVVTAALQEDVQGIAISSYQGGHVEYFKYMVDLLKSRGGEHIQVFGGGGGVIVPPEIRELQAYGVTRIYSPEDGQRMGLQGMIGEMVMRCDKDITQYAPKDLKAAYALYAKAADRGLADGAINLAVALAEGKGVDKNLPRAYALLTQASQAGSARATYDLAQLAEHGYGGKATDALGLYQRAAEFGFPKGHHTAAALLDEGRAGVAKDPTAAAQELLSAVAADSGESIADLTGKTQNWSPETIKALESRLAAAGYYSGPIDGKCGPELGPALRQWRLLGAPEKS